MCLFCSFLLSVGWSVGVMAGAAAAIFKPRSQAAPWRKECVSGEESGLFSSEELICTLPWAHCLGNKEGTLGWLLGHLGWGLGHNDGDREVRREHRRGPKISILSSVASPLPEGSFS